MGIKVTKLTDTATIPTRGSLFSAGWDLYCDDEFVVIGPGETKKISTNISIALPEGYVGLIFARSGLATKNGLRPANCVGVADSDYRGEYIVALHNDSKEIQTVKRGERIAQLVVTQYLTDELEVVEALDETERGAGGFGSTGK